MCSDSSLADLGGEDWAKPVPPEPYRLVADVDPALGQQILDVAQRQRVSHVHHHDQADDLRRAIEIAEWVAHGLKLPRRDAAGFLSDSTSVRDPIVLRAAERTRQGARCIHRSARRLHPRRPCPSPERRCEPFLLLRPSAQCPLLLVDDRRREQRSLGELGSKEQSIPQGTGPKLGRPERRQIRSEAVVARTGEVASDSAIPGSPEASLRSGGRKAAKPQKH